MFLNGMIVGLGDSLRSALESALAKLEFFIFEGCFTRVGLWCVGGPGWKWTRGAHRAISST